MCQWTVVDGTNHPPDDREVLIFIENDHAVYFGFCKHYGNKYVWLLNFFDDEYEVVEEEKIVCYLEYPHIEPEALGIPRERM